MAAKTAIDVTDAAIKETYEEIRKAGAETNWMLVSYPAGDNKKVVFVSKGAGGIDELKSNLSGEAPQYFYLRVSFQQPGDEVVRTKFVLIVYTAETVKPMLKGRVSVHTSAVKEVLKDWSISLQVSTLLGQLETLVF